MEPHRSRKECALRCCAGWEGCIGVHERCCTGYGQHTLMQHESRMGHTSVYERCCADREKSAALVREGMCGCSAECMSGCVAWEQRSWEGLHKWERLTWAICNLVCQLSHCQCSLLASHKPRLGLWRAGRDHQQPQMSLHFLPPSPLTYFCLLCY